VIPSAEDVLRWRPAIASRYERIDVVNEAAVQRALDRAITLADGDEHAEPAAVFMAFAETRAAFPGAWRLMAALLAERQAMAPGYGLTATAPELAALCSDVLHRRAHAADVAARFDAWLSPIRKA